MIVIYKFIATVKLNSTDTMFSYRGGRQEMTFIPQDQKLNSHLLPLFISYKSRGKKLIKYQANSPCVIMPVILMTTLSYKALILQGEI